MSRPVGGVLFPGPFRDTGSVTIHLCGPPGDVWPGRPSHDSALLRVGFAEPPGSPRALVRSYRTVSPLPDLHHAVQPSAVCFLWHFPADRSDWPLASTLPCGAPTFLDTIAEASCRGHPAGSPCSLHDRAPGAGKQAARRFRPPRRRDGGPVRGGSARVIARRGPPSQSDRATASHLRPLAYRRGGGR